MWKATKYTIFDHMAKAEVTRMAGGRRSARAFPATKPVSQGELQRKISPWDKVKRKLSFSYITPSKVHQLKTYIPVQLRSLKD